MFFQKIPIEQRSPFQWKFEKLINAMLLVMITIWMISCESKSTNSSGISKQQFGTLPDGRVVNLYTLQNRNGMTVKISDYGCIVQSIIVPDRNKHFSDVVLGFDSLQGYLKNNLYFGAIIGRYANRISNGKFVLDNRDFILEQNSYPNHLHGGVKGFDKKLWISKEIISTDNYDLQLTYNSPDGDQGYPGELKVTITYILSNNNELEIRYEAETSKPTIINLTNHTYFNLKDGGKTCISDHVLVLNADQFAPVTKLSVPLGEFRNCEGTPMDFRKPVSIGKRIESDDEQIRYGNGYDHSWVVNRTDQQLVKAAIVTEPLTGRMLEVWTTQPAIHLYTGNFLDGSFTGKTGTVYKKRNGFCLETQHFADSPNHTGFPTTVLRPGKKYEQLTVFRFKIDK